MTVAKAKVKALTIVVINLVQGSLVIITYNRYNNFIVQATSLIFALNDEAYLYRRYVHITSFYPP